MEPTASDFRVEVGCSRLFRNVS